MRRQPDDSRQPPHRTDGHVCACSWKYVDIVVLAAGQQSDGPIAEFFHWNGRSGDPPQYEIRVWDSYISPVADDAAARGAVGHERIAPLQQPSDYPLQQ